MESFKSVFNRNWGVVITGLIAVFSFQAILIANSFAKKVIYTCLIALLLTIIYSSFQYVDQYKKKGWLTVLLILFWLHILLLILLIELIL